jgi:hypothetical protein
MPYSGDPPNDTMQDRIEIKLRDLLAGSSDFDSLKVFYRGEPGFVPVKLYPFAIVFLSEEQEAIGQEGFGESTGLRYYRYDGYVSLEVLHKDTTNLMPDGDRYADVGSYLVAKELTQAAFNALLSWGGPTGELEDDPVVSNDGKEATVEFRTDSITNGLGRRGDNVSNRGTMNFHIYTRRQDW